MTTFSPGLSDSIAGVLDELQRCPHCASSSQIAGGLCVGCLLEAGLNAGDDDESETLTDILAEVRLPDQRWRLGNYEILEEIGRGGMGVIYRARQRHSRRIVAVKRVLSYHADSRETLARFRREAQAAASLDHPNILPIYEVSESEDGLPFFSMKFAPGGTLQQVAPALRKDPRQCVALVAKITRAVQYAHSRGILHRDLKPGNILLDGRGEPLVSDFGLAKWLGTTSDLTRTLTIFGTPGYIAPEQASAAAADLKPTADVYSLGAILFDLLAGRPPFLGSHALSVIRQAADSPAPKLRTLSKLADRDLETLCSRCLEREAAARYRSAHDLAEDLERWLQGRTIIARRTLPPARMWRWAKRKPKFAGVAAASLIMAAIAVVAELNRTRLESIVRLTETARRSVLVTSFDDLEEVSTQSVAAREATSLLATALSGHSGIQLRYPKTNKTANPWQTEDLKEMGKAAEARMVLAGTVRSRNGKKRVVIRMVESSTGTTVHTWLLEDNSFSDFIRTAGEAVSNSLENGTERPRTLGDTHETLARNHYEAGKEYFFRYNLPDLQRAIASMDKALEIDPNYAKAYALLASACQARFVIEPNGPWLRRSEEAAAKALQLAPTLPEAHRAVGGNLRYRGRLADAVDSYLTAYELEPGDPRAAATLGDAFQVLGRPDLAVRWFTRAIRDETRPVYAENLGDAWTDLGEYGKADEAFRTAAIFRPDLPGGDIGLIRLALFQKDYEQARTNFERIRAKFQSNPQITMIGAQVEFFARNYPAAEVLFQEALARDPAGGVDFAGSIRFRSALGFIRKVSGATDDGDAFLREARSLDEIDLRDTPANAKRLYSLAATEAALDNPDRALAALDRAITAGWIDYQSLSLDPRFDTLRERTHFQDVYLQLKTKVQIMKRTIGSNN